MRIVRAVLSGLLPAVLCALLLVTIYFTHFDWQWIAFLSGVFVAAVLALSSRAISAEWRVVRRSRQLEKLKGKLSWQTILYQRAEQMLADANSRFKLLWDALPESIVYVDAQQHCRHHNAAFERALGLVSEQIDGCPLRRVTRKS